MAISERRERILALLKESSYLSVDELGRLVHASEATIRRDLAELEDEGCVKRRRGGALYVDPEFVNWPLAFRNKTHYDEKLRIARVAARLVPDGSTVMLDSSSTCLCLARALTAKEGLRVTTCSIPAAQALAEGSDDCEVELTGGVYRREHASMQGQECVDCFARRRANLGFVSAVGLSADFGLSDYSHKEAAIKQAIRSSCRTLVALVDHNKVGGEFYIRDLPLEQIDVLVCDSALPDDLAYACERAGTRAIVAK